MKKQIYVTYKGTVQGVGFRFTSEGIANEFGITGWVKNLFNGDVEIVAEGDEKTLNDFLDKIGKYFSKYIEDTDVKWLEYTGKFKEFGVRF